MPSEPDAVHPAPAGYLPLADYGVIGDGRSIALVANTGAIDWWCLPRFDGDPIFARLLDTRLGGSCVIQPRCSFHGRQAYLGETNVLATTFTTDAGEARVVDFMPALTEAQKRRYPIPFREIVRRVEGISGRVPMQLLLRPRPDYGRLTPRVRQTRADRYVIEWRDQALHVTAGVPLHIDPGTLTASFDLVPGQRVDLVLSYSSESPAELPTLGSLDLMQRLTVEFWEAWIRQCGYTGPYQSAVRRSALVLKLLTYAPSGAIIAAPTTSLPEQIGGVRNWDYRYCWLRDAAFTIRALLSLNYQREAHAFAEWLLHVTRLTHPELQVLYTLYGEADIPERTLDYLEGYRGSRPVRVGNAAAEQFQLDVYGEVIDALRIYHRVGGSFDRDGRRLIAGLAEVIARRWHEPDDGIWEVRSGRAQHIHSKVMAWVGLQAAIEIAQHERLPISVPHLERTADEIQAWVLRHGYDPGLGAFTRTYGSGDLDAALLVVPLVDFLDQRDPRVAEAVRAIERRLTRDDLVHRYLGEDGLPGEEGAFLICSFWLVEALARTGRLDEAHERFQRLLARANPLGLLAEEVDPVSGEQLGNFPQAFSHIGLINAAVTLHEVEQQPQRGAYSRVVGRSRRERPGMSR
ncbi:glycoside hydrolase family 15 protein [Sphaerobacter thermophilus]|uniref:Glycoside hydrolase 15-related protein n=1 Tax=Sphaerobacter thermophilus (strain ATCC 49802 / DSM 20745 / KCCM 41009 / NCIMB 13125 / S 6022) TaxID=479434 RepID=D1C9X9_SPHTD|nr:glycoside hydrolase family 15 protein [Sphaerobacter thermophilus]ACZ40622.1 glycoside hydrolase 15-related protein [Sphaerobacter thermophilus DSM 20745]